MITAVTGLAGLVRTFPYALKINMAPKTARNSGNKTDGAKITRIGKDKGDSAGASRRPTSIMAKPTGKSTIGLGRDAKTDDSITPLLEISHGSVLSSLSDKLQFPSFLRTVPNYSFQNIAIARLIGHFQWTWVGMIVSTDEVGLQGGLGIRKFIEDSGGCVAFMEQVSLRFPKERILHVVQLLRGHSVKVIIVHSPDVHVKLLLEMLYEENVTDKVWVFTAAFTLGPGLLLENQAWKILNGSLGLAPYTERMLKFEEFLSHIHPSKHPDDIFMKYFWENAFHCIFEEENGTKSAASKDSTKRLKTCSGDETLENVARFLFELNDLSYSYHSYIAVYVFAHAIDALITCEPGRGPFTNGSCADISDIKPWQEEFAEKADKVVSSKPRKHEMDQLKHEVSEDDTERDVQEAKDTL
ncbi:hypothetical protein NDU88_009328 [Pleurodeles waltl]|uniref:Receptor ligand binding region domain-containing protein n=1 Tax=Pleurodeles waltl TaxID=8319 RepID=A0AAV7P1P2_PLEWA|nr:hypothetical protein NDU88_009328 [Pleurodeles waltl]